MNIQLSAAKDFFFNFIMELFKHKSREKHIKNPVDCPPPSQLQEETSGSTPSSHPWIILKLIQDGLYFHCKYFKEYISER